nr:uncharacterized protein LOC111108136 isoform X2 [Crassostrea virginica]
MDPRYSAQDALQCGLCEAAATTMYCDICRVNLCKACVGEHLSDTSTYHKVVPFEQRESTTKCPKHSTKVCELYCKHCNAPICALCVASGHHDRHKKEDIASVLAHQKEIVKKDLEELETLLNTKYQNAALNILVQKEDVRTYSLELTSALKKREEALYEEISCIIQSMQSEVDEMGSKHLSFISEQESKINQTITEIEQNIAEMKRLIESDNVYFVFSYKSKNEEFRELPAPLQVSLPTFTPYEINREQICQQIGSLSKLSITTEKNGGGQRKPSRVLPPPPPTRPRPIIGEPRILTEIKTQYGMSNALSSVAGLSDSKLWTSGSDKIVRLYNLQGELLKSVLTKSGNWPGDVAVTPSGEMVYTDPRDSSVYIVKKKKIKLLIRLHGWKPLQVCATSSGELLVSMTSDDNKQTKVVRYSESTEKQAIQLDDEGQPLYSSTPTNDSKHLAENTNLDICVADREAGAVVVVSAAGKLCFRYTGTPSSDKESFNPVGLATDSKGRILTTDHWNNCIHILSQDGHFLYSIDNCRLHGPWGICVDSKNNLFVAEYYTGKVKKIQYYK